jgi:hypothetical protein
MYTKHTGQPAEGKMSSFFFLTIEAKFPSSHAGGQGSTPEVTPAL